MADLIVLAGAVAGKPYYGGHTWVFLQYLLGLRRLGWDVLFLDHLDAAGCRDAAGQPCPPDRSTNLSYLLDVFGSFGLTESFAVLGEDGQSLVGLSRKQVLEKVGQAASLINVMGFLKDEEILGRARQRVFLDIDPGFGQIWCDLGLHDPFRGHDVHVTIGENINQPDCAIPTLGLDWLTTRQPVVLDYWPARPASGGRWTSVASWRGAYGPLEYHGKRYGLRVHEFRKFWELPRLHAEPMEIALEIHPVEVNDLTRLTENGWRLADPKAVASDPWSYQAYLQGSRGEFTVAKNLYVEAKTGWFSDRSMCYLASGRPVVAQETGYSRYLPTGEGLVAFTTLDEAAAAIKEVSGNYPSHARAARALAEEFFASDKVLGRLLDLLGVA